MRRLKLIRLTGRYRRRDDSMISLRISVVSRVHVYTPQKTSGEYRADCMSMLPSCQASPRRSPLHARLLTVQGVISGCFLVLQKADLLYAARRVSLFKQVLFPSPRRWQLLCGAHRELLRAICDPPANPSVTIPAAAPGGVTPALAGLLGATPAPGGAVPAPASGGAAPAPASGGPAHAPETGGAALAPVLGVAAERDAAVLASVKVAWSTGILRAGAGRRLWRGQTSSSWLGGRGIRGRPACASDSRELFQVSCRCLSL